MNAPKCGEGGKAGCRTLLSEPGIRFTIGRIGHADHSAALNLGRRFRPVKRQNHVSIKMSTIRLKYGDSGGFRQPPERDEDQLYHDDFVMEYGVEPERGIGPPACWSRMRDQA